MEGDQKELSKKEKIGRWLRSTWNDVKSFFKAVGRWLRSRWNDAKSFFKEAPPAVLLAVGLAVAIYVAHKPASVIDHEWSRFEVFHRGILWLVRSTAFRSIVAPLVLLVSYGLVYYAFWIRGRWFIVVSDFRVWGKLKQRLPVKGAEALLRDELLRLESELKPARPEGPNDSFDVSEQARMKARPVVLEDEGISLPETYVTLQYEGISLEAMHTLVRRVTGREVVINGDLMRIPSGVKLVARTSDDGPWEVVVKSADLETLRFGMQRLALQIITAAMTKRFRPKSERVCARLQLKAKELEEYEQALDLAKLGFQVARGKVEKTNARTNLATAYNDAGIGLGNSEKYREACSNFFDAIRVDPRFDDTFNNLKLATELIQDKQESDETLIAEAEEIRSKS